MSQEIQWKTVPVENKTREQAHILYLAEEAGFLIVTHGVDKILPESDEQSLLAFAELLLANFPRPSQNQTVASGVEGAHEGTTADKSGSRFRGEWFCPKCKQKTVNIYLPDSYDEPDATAHFRCENCDWFGDSRVEPTPESREPEKLNNAQEVELCDKCGFPESEFVHRSGGSGDPYHKFVALAESSLSSPPHPDDE